MQDSTTASRNKVKNGGGDIEVESNRTLREELVALRKKGSITQKKLDTNMEALDRMTALCRSLSQCPETEEAIAAITLAARDPKSAAKRRGARRRRNNNADGQHNDDVSHDVAYNHSKGGSRYTQKPGMPQRQQRDNELMVMKDSQYGPALLFDNGLSPRYWHGAGNIGYYQSNVNMAQKRGMSGGYFDNNHRGGRSGDFDDGGSSPHSPMAPNMPLMKESPQCQAVRDNLRNAATSEDLELAMNKAKELNMKLEVKAAEKKLAVLKVAT